jgi:CheY-like chemotaxis protein
MLVVGVGDQFWGLPEASVIATMTLADPRVELTGGGREMTFEGSRIPVVSLGTVLGIVHFNSDQEVVVLTGRSGLVAVTVPEIIDRRRVAVKDLGPILEGSSNMTAAAFLGGGEVLVVVDPNYLADIARAGDQAAAVRPSVLVVDDSAGVRQLIAATLSGAGFDVMVAPDAKEAVLKLAEMAMDVLVVDYSMPRSSGVDLVRALRAADVTIPIVMVSGVATPDEQKAAWEAGVDVYMDKFDLRKGVLTSTIRRLLSDRRHERV